MRKDSDALLSHARAITAREEVDAQQTECAYQHQHDAHRNAYRIHCHEEEYRQEPEPEMREDVHHHIEDNRRGGLAHSRIRLQLHDAVRLAAHQSTGRSIVECKPAHGQFVHAPEGKPLHLALVIDDEIPRDRVHHIHHQPQGEYQRKVDARLLQIAPDVGIVHIHRTEHDDDGDNTEGHEDVSESVIHKKLF